METSEQLALELGAAGRAQGPRALTKSTRAPGAPTTQARATRQARARRPPEPKDLPAGQDSWVDAVVTLLAVVIFGLGWVLVELERADPPTNRYDRAVSAAWSASVTHSIEERSLEGDRVWTEVAHTNSKR